MAILEAFEQHVQSVHKLMNFDREVLSHAIDAIEILQQRLTQHHKIDNPHLTVERTLQILRNYRQHDSLRHTDKTIFNQAVVLLVSYFGAAVHDVFRAGVSAALASDRDSPLLREQLKLSFAELREANFDLRKSAPDLLVNARDISFQDMTVLCERTKTTLALKSKKHPWLTTSSSLKLAATS